MSAIQHLLTEHLDIWTAADTGPKSGRGRSSANAASVYGIRKLRELILELAVRGKLVPQDASDEPASELLKRIQAEKVKLVAEGKIRKDKPLPPITDAEKPFELPHGWAWARLNDFVLSIISGGTPSKNNSQFWGGNIPWASVKDLNVEKFLKETQDHITKEGLDDGSKLANKGDLLICTRMGLGKIAVAAVDVAINQDLKALKITSLLDVDYFINFYRTLKIAGSGMTVAGIKQDELLSYCVPTPPFAEQIRIVAKVDELMALCDQLETEHKKASAAHEKIVSELLATLTQSPLRAESAPVRGEPVEPHSSMASTSSPSGRTEFEENWQRIAAHFDTLFTTESSIDALKQTLLQLAVMGKLVPQNPNDEPASELLKKERILFESSTIAGWCNVSLGNFGSILGGGTPSKANAAYWDGAIPWVSPKDMKQPFIHDSEDHISEIAISETVVKLVPSGSLLMVVRGMILAHSFPVALTRTDVAINQDMKALVIPESLRNYLLLFLQARKQSFVDLVDRSSHGTCKLISEKLWAMRVAVPPLAEQHRIVAKVDELMTLCDHLKSRLTEASQLQQKLADVLVENVVSGQEA
jgi:type I restriction enzyme S subunit